MAVRDARGASGARPTQVATILAAAAIVASLLGARASLLAGEAADGWQTAVRRQVQHGAADVNSAILVYGRDAENLSRFQEARIRGEEYTAERAAVSGDERAAPTLDVEVGVQEVSRRAAEPLVAEHEAYVHGDTFDVRRRLEDRRRRDREGLESPAQAQRDGDRRGRQAAWTAAAAIPAALAFLLGSLAQASARPRRGVVAGGALLVVASLAAALVVQVLLG